MKTVDIFWSFRSPYSYLATKRLRALPSKWEARFVPRPVYPIAIRTPDFFANAHPQWTGYLLRDVFRLSDYLGVPIGRPNPDPVVMDMATREIAADQPYIHRLTRLGILAAEAGDEAGWAFLDEVSSLIWTGAVKWDDGTHLAEAAVRAGFDLAALDAREVSERDRLDQAIEDNQAAQSAGGHWGVPLMVLDGEPFFGQDRIELLEWRLARLGVAEKI